MSKDLDVEIKKAVERINNVLEADSNFKIVESQLHMALIGDVLHNGGHLITEEEIDELIMGDDDGNVPPKLKRMFPRINKAIADQF